MNRSRIISWFRNYRHSARLRVRTSSQTLAADNVSAGGVVLRVCMILVVWLVVTASLLFKSPYHGVPYVVGQDADSTVIAEIPFAYSDPVQTQLQRLETARKTPPVFRVDTSGLKRTATRMGTLQQLLAIRDAAAGQGEELHAAETSPHWRNRDDVFVSVREMVAGLSPRQRETLEYLAISSGKWEALTQQVLMVAAGGVASEKDVSSKFAKIVAESAAIHVCDDRYRKRVYAWNELLTPSKAAGAAVGAFHKIYSPGMAAETAVLEEIIPLVIEPNLVYDPVMMGEARESAAALVPVVETQVPAGTELLRMGQIVQREDWIRLERYQQKMRELHRPATANRNALSFSVLFLVVLLCAAYFMQAIHAEAVERNKNVFLIGSVLVLQVMLCRIVGAWVGNVPVLGAVALPLILPLSFGSMLLANLVGLRVALLAGCVSAFATALHFTDFSPFSATIRFDQPFMLLTVGAVASFVAAVLMRHSRRRYHAVRTGIGVGATTAATAFVFLFCMHVPASQAWEPLLLVAFGNGIILALVAAYVMPLFEAVFGITTDMTLMELSDLNHPLLKRLQLEAPGTYHHSLTVATLAEECAAAIGANPLLARVCGYFHDIGKLVNPEYFTENGVEDNPHEELRPSLSNLVILNHVKCGLELAAKYKLQRPIREAIAQHHGTSLVYFFYRRAVEQQQDEDPQAPPVGEHEYRYSGPLPGRKEIAILAIVDTCEAAARSLAKPTPQRIRVQVEELISNRILDGQFEDADLTFHELSQVKETLIKSLSTMLHSRVRYPKENEDIHVESDDEQEDVGDTDSPAPRAGRIPESRG